LTGRCAQTGTVATGVPVLTEIMRRIENIESSMSGKLDELPLALRDEMLKSLSINGAVPVTPNDIEQLKAYMRQCNTEASAGAGSNVTSPSPNESMRTANGSWSLEIRGKVYSLWAYRGQVSRAFPEDFKMPRGTTRDICDKFVFGDTSIHTVPFGHPYFIATVKLLSRTDQGYYAKAAQLYQVMK
jgi:hypothetical protein